MREAGWAPALIVFLSLVIGKMLRGYITFPWLDKLFHVAGGMAIAYFFSVSISHLQKLVGPIAPTKRLMLSLGLTIGAAIAWELLELMGDGLFQTKMNFGMVDTLWDVIFGLLGGLALVLLRADHANIQ